jgi:hypothetical protein
MPGTDGSWNQDTPNSDLEIFVGPSEFFDALAHMTYAASTGTFYMNLAASLAADCYGDVAAAFKRVGAFATPAAQQQQYGTAASLPGPTSVSGTSDPEGIRGYPPYTASRLATLVGPSTGVIPKGIQINSMDVIYQVNGSAALSLAQIGLYANQYVDGAAGGALVTYLTLGANGLATAQRAGIYKTNVPIPTPSFLVTPATILFIEAKFTTQAGGTLNFYGVNLKCSYNFN